MKLELPPSRSDSIPLGHGDAAAPGLARNAGDTALAAENEATLRLIRGCVEAMGLLQAKHDSLETELIGKIDARARELEELRTALSQSQAVTASTVQRLQDSAERIARLEEDAKHSARQFSDDLATARAEANNWRMRAETDAMAFEHLNARLTSLEAGLSARLDAAHRNLAESQAANTQLRSRAEGHQAKAGFLEAQLRDVEATIADQRSRINCLQSKLSAASYTMRVDHLSRNAGGLTERDILDLQGLGKTGMISAA